MFLATLAGLLSWAGSASADPAATVTIGPVGAGINASTYNSDSFIVDNDSTAGETITEVVFDFRGALLFDLIFDPDGTGGDQTARDLTPNSGDAAATGLIDNPTPFEVPNGGGYDVLRIAFNDFDPTETFRFAVDVDPNSIKGVAAPGPGDSGSVSGLELTASTVTVAFSDGTVLVGRPFRDGSSNSASTVTLGGTPPPAPTVELLGVSSPSNVTDPDQVVRITGTPGANVELLHFEAALFTAGVPDGGFELDPFEANTILSVDQVGGTLNGSGVLDVPVTLLSTDPEAGYNVFVAAEVGAGAALSDSSDPATYLLGSTPPPPGPISFLSGTAVQGVDILRPTSLQWGPDGRLYVSQQNGLIKVFTVQKNGPADYTATATETLSLIKNIPNHNDDGTVNTSIDDRQVTGLLVVGTSSNPVIYVGSSDPRIGAGGSGTDTDLDTNSSMISRLTWNGSSWDKLDLVRGLPRSEENHAINGLALDPSTNTLYVQIGGFTNMGAPSNNFALTPEYALSAALISVDLDAIGDTTYDLPTLDDETRSNNPDGSDVGDPFGGNDGKNQALLVPGGPVGIYSPGWRNAYDLVLTDDGRMYSIDNGPNGGWGDTPISCTNQVSEPGKTYWDALHLISGPGYYAGHPNPTRANSANTFNSSNPQSPVPPGYSEPCDYRIPVVEDGALTLWNSSTNGMTEYTSTVFGGQMKGNLLAVSFSKHVRRVQLNASGDDVITGGVTDLFSNVGSTPLDITAMGDNEAFPGTIWIADFGGRQILVFEPEGSSTCEGQDIDFDEDGDGFWNSVEIAVGTDPCSAADRPADNDGDFIPDQLDNDDDNDGLNDGEDRFAVDASNGANRALPVRFTWDNNEGALGGLLDLGFTGLMTDGLTNYADRFDPAQMTAGGAAGAVTVDAVTGGTAEGAANDLDYGFQFGVTTGVTAFTARSSVLAPFAGQTPDAQQRLGLFLGTGEQDNYIEIVVTGAGIQVGLEVDGVYQSGAFAAVALPGPDTVTLELQYDPDTSTIQPAYAILAGGVQGDVVPLGAPLPIPSSWIGGTDATAVGITSSSAGSVPFPATWAFIEAVPTGTGGGGAILHRVNAGGSQLPSTDTGPDWAGGNQGLVTSANSFSTTKAISWDGPEPAALFQSEAWDGGAGDEMLWEFSVPADGLYEVRLYFAEIYGGAASVGARVFDVTVEDLPMLINYDIYADVGEFTGVVKSFTVLVTDGAASIEFIHGVQNPKISALEVVDLQAGPGPDCGVDADCDDGLFCNGLETCLGGSCTAGITVSCEDSVLCTVDTCNEVTDTCDHTPLAGLCDNGVFCDGIEDCDAALGCQAGGPACSASEVCDESSQTCTVPECFVDADCDDGSFCNGFETCLGGLCAAGMTVSCDDGVACTVDACDEGIDACAYTPTASLCDNGLFCDGAEICDAALGCQPGTDACGPDELCDEVNQLCAVPECDLDADCDDGLYCNGAEACLGGLCTAGTTVTCDDGVACTVDACDEVVDACEYAPTASLCDNGLFCDGAEACDATLGCQPGAPIACGPDEVCDEATLTCTPIGGGLVLHRVNAGGLELLATDGGPAWLGGNAGLATKANNFSTQKSITWSGDAPAALFQSEAWDSPSGVEMRWEFPIAASGLYEVRLYFAEIYRGAAVVGGRVFDVTVEGATVLDDYDIFADVGAYTGVIKAFVVAVDDGAVSVEFLHAIQNPKVSGFEIIAR